MSEINSAKDVKKALVSCVLGECKNCIPNNSGKDCRYNLISNAYELILRYDTTLKAVTKEKDKAWELYKQKVEEDIQLQSRCDLLKLQIEGRMKSENETIVRQRSEIDRLVKSNEQLNARLDSLEKSIDNELIRTKHEENLRKLFFACMNKFMSAKDLFVVVDGEYLPWEPAEEVQSLFGIEISGDNDEEVIEANRVIKKILGEA